MGLMPIMWSVGAGSDLMKRVAAPMVGGLFTSFLMELLVNPAIYLLWKNHTRSMDRSPTAVCGNPGMGESKFTPAGWGLRLPQVWLECDDPAPSAIPLQRQ